MQMAASGHPSDRKGDYMSAGRGTEEDGEVEWFRKGMEVVK